jgi:hypothetical protein
MAESVLFGCIHRNVAIVVQKQSGYLYSEGARL